MQKVKYNHATSFGRKKLLLQARKNYNNGTNAYKQYLKKGSITGWLSVLVCCCVLFGAFYFLYQSGLFVKWAR